ncbi:MAG: deoxyribose-phosphate aldolase [Christensenella sp.]|uniref:deoxyribose-phosphate aldolase n=1 Tax=Christensenella sp. TaxID=1935934 RepID=UPI002B20F2D0|nr:deoxyribose-phosphate aldolase [Christensenella sp.]MEA5003725.1 deoxyribose-phosphate aldolase [Christensenella sp.]
MSPASMAKYIDHTILKPEASLDDVRKVCEEAKKYQFASVCVNPSYIRFVADNLNGSGVTPCCVIGFPLGACTPEAKGNEAADAASNGAKEVDMVINVGAIKSGDWQLVKRDIEAVVGAVRGRAIVKVIIETCLLTDEEKVKACAISKLAGAHFVKTSTGFSKGGATVEDVRLMRETVGPEIGVKASGGVKTYEDAVAMVQAGASRLGTSSGAAIVSGGGADTHKCVNCGACKQTCPTGNATIVKNCY